MRVTKNGEAIKPIWEHHENSKGGEWTWRISKESSTKVWETLLLSVIGEQFSEQIEGEDDICGLTVKLLSFKLGERKRKRFCFYVVE